MQDEERRLWFKREVVPLEPILRARALRLTHGSEEAEDLLHDTYAKLMSFPGWAQIENVRAFALTVMKNTVLVQARRRKIVSIQVIAELDSLDIADDMPPADRVLEAREELQTLNRLIEKLPSQCRRVFVLHKIYNLSQVEIAGRLDLSISTVEKHVAKGLRFCSEHLLRGPAALSPLQVRTPWTPQRKDNG